MGVQAVSTPNPEERRLIEWLRGLRFDAWTTPVEREELADALERTLSRLGEAEREQAELVANSDRQDALIARLARDVVAAESALADARDIIDAMVEAVRASLEVPSATERALGHVGFLAARPGEQQ